MLGQEVKNQGVKNSVREQNKQKMFCKSRICSKITKTLEEEPKKTGRIIVTW